MIGRFGIRGFMPLHHCAPASDSRGNQAALAEMAQID
jgi:hypothetical protein